MTVRRKNWEAYSRDRAYELVAWLRRQGFTLTEPHVDAIRIWLRVENKLGAERIRRAQRPRIR